MQKRKKPPRFPWAAFEEPVSVLRLAARRRPLVRIATKDLGRLLGPREHVRPARRIHTGCADKQTSATGRIGGPHRFADWLAHDQHDFGKVNFRSESVKGVFSGIF